jgi:hypothetical protein
MTREVTDPAPLRPIYGAQTMLEAMSRLGYTCSVEETGGGVETVYVFFADGVRLACGDSESGEWQWVLEGPDGPLDDPAPGFLSGAQMLATVAVQQAQHGGAYRADDDHEHLLVTAQAWACDNCRREVREGQVVGNQQLCDACAADAVTQP